MTKYDRPPKAELVDKVLEMGLTNEELVREYHVSERTIRNWLTHYNIRRYGATHLMQRAAYTLRRDGFSIRDVANVLNTSHTNARRMADQYEKWREQDGDFIQHG